MKCILVLLLPLLAGFSSNSQTVTYEDFRAIIPFLQKEEYKPAFEKSKQLLASTQNDSSDLRGIITYIAIYSAAGMVTVDQMTHDEFSKIANQYIGQRLVMSAHPCYDTTGHGFNALQFFTRSNGRLQGMTTTSNNAKTNILCFEYFNYAENINPDEFIGKSVRCGGTLTSVEVNPNKSKVWISRLHIDNAFARSAQ